MDIPDFPVRFTARQPLLESGHLHTRIVSSSWTVFDLTQLFQSVAQSIASTEAAKDKEEKRDG